MVDRFMSVGRFIVCLLVRADYQSNSLNHTREGCGTFVTLLSALEKEIHSAITLSLMTFDLCIRVSYQWIHCTICCVLQCVICSIVSVKIKFI